MIKSALIVSRKDQASVNMLNILLKKMDIYDKISINSI